MPPLKRCVCTLALLVAACGTTPSTVRASSSRDEEHPSGQGFLHGRNSHSRTLDITLAANKPRDCDAEHNACFDACWNSEPPESHIPRGKAQHYQYCTSKCLKQYMECCKQQEQRPHAFPSMRSALDWLEEHKTEVVVGSIVIVAGATFIVVTGGTGALALVPLAVL